MIQTVVMPQLGLTMEEGTVVDWLKEVGDRVEVGEPLLIVENDKSEVEIEAVASGYLLRVAAPGLTAPVGAVIATLGDIPDEQADDVQLYEQ